MKDDVRSLTKRYVSMVESALQELKDKSSQVSNEKVTLVIDEANRYLTDAKYFLNTGKEPTALASVSYAEGLLDALKMMEFVNFVWKRPD